MKISHIAWSREDTRLCIGCGKQTSWHDGVCNVCTEAVPHYIPYSQHRRWYANLKLKERGLT